jgi:hypothetical protein
MDFEPIFAKAVTTRTISPADWAEIQASGKLEPSTSVRKSIFHGEQLMLYFSFVDHGSRRIGFLGFNEKGVLVSIDEHPSRGGIKYLLLDNVWRSAKILDTYRTPTPTPCWRPVRD